LRSFFYASNLLNKNLKNYNFIFETVYVLPSAVASTTFASSPGVNMVLSKDTVADSFSKFTAAV